MSAPTVRRPAAIFIFVTVMLDMLAFGMLAPVLPALIRDMAGDAPHAVEFHNGLLFSMWAAFQFIAMPVLGALSDRFGRRPVILISNFGLAASFVLYALAPTLVWLYVARTISGFTAGNYSTAAAYIADVTAPENRAKEFGKISAAFGLGFIIGPWVGGELGHIDPRLPFWVAAGLCLLSSLYGIFVLPESLPREKRSPVFRFTRANPIGALAFLRMRPGLLGLAGAMFLIFLAHVIFPSFFTLYVLEQFHWTSRDAGRVLMLVGALSVIVGVAIIPHSVRLLGERGAILTGLGVGVAAMAVFGFAPNGQWILYALVPGALVGIAQPALQSVMSARVASTEQGALQGAAGSLRGFADLIGPAVFNAAFAVGRTPEVGLPGAPWLIAGLLLAGAFVTAWFTLARLPARPDSEPTPAASETG